ncbi:hypothetical protein ACH5RR_033831 [Cinchona calisaya]|uniref:Uncharacterized protein n=1 Tax=Cinchona calisaya TaxID=153742 RepID=A0ABD2YA21_9GENT
MGNTYFITCRAPFPPEESSYTISQKDATALFDSLAFDIQKLQKALSANSLTLQWYILRIDIAVTSMSDGESLADIQGLDRQGMKLYDTLKWKSDNSSEVPMHISKNDSIQDLAKCFNNKSNITVGNPFVAFLDYEMIEKSIIGTKFHLNNQNVTERAKATIQQKSTDLKVGLEVFESEVTKVFEEVLRSRNKLLQQVILERTSTDKDLSPYKQQTSD